PVGGDRVSRRRAGVTDSIRSLQARAAAHHSWAATPNRRERTSPGTRAFLDRFAREIDPEGVLPPDELKKRAAAARSAYFAELAIKSVRARQAAKAKKQGRAAS